MGCSLVCSLKLKTPALPLRFVMTLHLLLGFSCALCFWPALAPSYTAMLNEQLEPAVKEAALPFLLVPE